MANTSVLEDLGQSAADCLLALQELLTMRDLRPSPEVRAALAEDRIECRPFAEEVFSREAFAEWLRVHEGRVVAVAGTAVEALKKALIRGNTLYVAAESEGVLPAGPSVSVALTTTDSSVSTTGESVHAFVGPDAYKAALVAAERVLYVFLDANVPAFPHIDMTTTARWKRNQQRGDNRLSWHPSDVDVAGITYDALEWCWRRLDAQGLTAADLDILAAELQRQRRADKSRAGKGPDDSTAGEVLKPKKYLISWRDILASLGLTNNVEDREKVRYLNEKQAGPILFPSQGAQPKVERTKLLEWWNHLEVDWAVGHQHYRDAGPTAEAQHPYGQAGTVTPDIEGSIKKRRKDRKG
jgi:hypothetical protein